MAAYYDFFRKIVLSPDGITLEADSVTDVLTISRGTGVAFTSDVSTDTFGIGVDYQLFVPIGTTTIRLQDINSNTRDVAITAGSNMSVGRNSANELVLTATVGGTSKVINSITQANPVVVTTNTQHQFTEGIAVTITDVVGTTELNGNEYYMDILTSTTFALYTNSNLTTPVDGTAHTAYGSGGVAVAEYGAPQALSQLSDVDLVGSPPVSGSFLQYTGTYWGIGNTLRGDFTGSVFADDSTLLVDGVNGSIPYSVLTGTPTIPTNNNQLTNGSAYATSLGTLSDVVAVDNTNFNNSLKIGDTTTGILNNALENVILGKGAANAITSGKKNVIIGFQAHDTVETSYGATVVGTDAVGVSKFLNETVSIGHLSTSNGNSGDVVQYGVHIGSSAGNGGSNRDNVYVGYMSGYSSTKDGNSYNVGIGTSALQSGANSANRARNIAVGHEAGTGLANNATDQYGVYIGVQAGHVISSGQNNIFIGKTAGDLVSTGSNNIILGDYAGTAAMANEIHIYNDTTERLKIDATGAMRVNGAFTFPIADGTSNQVLQTDGSGQVSWSSFAAAAWVDLTGKPTTLTGFGITDAVQQNTSFDGDVTGSVFGDDSSVLLDGNNKRLSLGGTTLGYQPDGLKLANTNYQTNGGFRNNTVQFSGAIDVLDPTRADAGYAGDFASRKDNGFWSYFRGGLIVEEMAHFNTQVLHHTNTKAQRWFDNPGATEDINFNYYDTYYVQNMAQDTTFNLINPSPYAAVASTITIIINQTATPRMPTLTLLGAPANIRWQNSIVPSAVENSLQVFEFTWLQSWTVENGPINWNYFLARESVYTSV